MRVERHHRALAGAAAGHHEVHRLGVQQQAGDDAQVDVGQAVVVVAVHADVEDAMALLAGDVVELLQDHRVLGGLAKLVHECDFHGNAPLGWGRFFQTLFAGSRCCVRLVAGAFNCGRIVG